MYSASPISLLSMGRVCGWSLMAGKILFTGRQICSLYLVLCLCGTIPFTSLFQTNETLFQTPAIEFQTLAIEFQSYVI